MNNVRLVSENGVSNIQKKLWYVDDSSEINLDNFEAGDRIYSINDNKLFQIEYDTSSEQEYSGEIVSFEADEDDRISSVIAEINPIQDLHGYDHPWPAGGGKNQFNPADLRSGKAIYGNESVGQQALLFDSAATDTYVNIAYLSVGTWTLSYSMNGSSVATGSRVGYICDADGVVLQKGITTWSNNATSLQIEVTTAGYLWGSVDKNAINLQLESGSSATPYVPYSNECPISGHTGAEIQQTGKNIADPSKILEKSGWTESDGVYTGTSNALNSLTYENPEGRQACLQLDYYGSAGSRAGYFRFEYADGTLDYIEVIGTTWTHITGVSNANKVLKKVTFGYSNSLTMHIKNLQIEFSSTISAYEPYTGSQISVTFPTTIYGGSDEVIGGTLIDTHQKQVLDGDRAYSSFGERTNTCRVYLNLRNDMKAYSGSEINIMSVSLPVYRPDYVYSNDIEGLSQNNNSSQDQSGLWISVLKSRLSSVSLDGVKEYFRNNPCEFLFIRATPLEYQLSTNELTTLYGQNNVWTDVGEINVKVIKNNITAFELKPHI